MDDYNNHLNIFSDTQNPFYTLNILNSDYKETLSDYKGFTDVILKIFFEA